MDLKTKLKKWFFQNCLIAWRYLLRYDWYGGVEAQKEMLEKEGHIVIQKGRTNIKYYVKDYEKALFTL